MTVTIVVERLQKYSGFGIPKVLTIETVDMRVLGGVAMFRRTVVLLCGLAAAACSPSDSGSPTNAMADANTSDSLPTAQPDGSPLTASFCEKEAESAYTPFKDSKSCFMKACETGDDASCEMMKSHNGSVRKEDDGAIEPGTKAAATNPSFDAIWKDGQAISGTCYAKVGQTVVMDGACSGLGHGNSLFVTAEADGCSFDIDKRGSSANGTLFGYRDVCGDIEEDVAVGPFSKVGDCWKASNAQFCLKPSP